jgi:hypothetical protein
VADAAPRQQTSYTTTGQMGHEFHDGVIADESWVSS